MSETLIMVHGHTYRMTYRRPHPCPDYPALPQASPRLSRNHRSSAPASGGASSTRWSGVNGASRPCQTYENLEFLYKTSQPSSSAPSEVSMPPPLPLKSIQRGELEGRRKRSSSCVDSSPF